MWSRRFCTELGLVLEAWGSRVVSRRTRLQIDLASGSLKAVVVWTGAVSAVTCWLAVGCISSPGAADRGMAFSRGPARYQSLPVALAAVSSTSPLSLPRCSWLGPAVVPGKRDFTLRVRRRLETPAVSGAPLRWLREKPCGCSLPLPALRACVGKGGEQREGREPELPVRARRGGKSTWRWGGWRAALGGRVAFCGSCSCRALPRQLWCCCFTLRLGVLIRKSLPRWMLFFLGVILSSEAVSGTRVPAPGWLRFRAEGRCSPWLEALRRERDAGWDPSAGCLVLTNDGMLGAGPLLLAGAMRFGTACDVGLGPGRPLLWRWEQGSRQPCRCGWSGELSLHGAVALLRVWSLQRCRCQRSPDFGSGLLVAQPPASALRAADLAPLGQTDTGARHPSLGKEPTLRSVCWGPGSWRAGVLLT